jgi:hypothetical protein
MLARVLPAVVAAAGLWLLPGPSEAAREIVCQSFGKARTFCEMPAGSRVRLERQLSAAPCIEGRTWGVGERRIWVSHRCGGRFRYAPPDDPDVGALVGALIVGGVIGAVIGSQINNSSDLQVMPQPNRPFGVTREEAVRLCNVEARNWGRRKGWIEVRWRQLISAEFAAQGRMNIRALMEVVYREPGSRRIVSRNMRYLCVAEPGRVMSFRWY